MRAIASLIVVLLVAATGAPRVQPATRDDSALRSSPRDTPVLAARAGSAVASVRRAAQLDPHASPVALVAVASLVPPPRVPLPASPAPHTASARPRLVACSARGPPRG